MILAGLVSIPTGWQYLHTYQRDRLLTFLDPERDALGAGYHIIQSKIALGSGAVFGKGFMQGTQSHLNFLPEKQTDFVFTVFAEEFGLIGGLVLLALYIVLLVYALVIAVRVRNQFGRLVAMGAGATFFIYVFINIAMVMGLIPVVGRAAAADLLWRYRHGDHPGGLRLHHQRPHPSRYPDCAPLAAPRGLRRPTTRCAAHAPDKVSTSGPESCYSRGRGA